MKVKKTLTAFKGPILIFIVVVLANILYVSGAFTANPLYRYSGLATNTKVGVLSSGQPTIDPNNAYTTQALGHAAARNLRHGHIPWWNYDEQVGAPLAGEMQSAALFLPFNLLLGLGGGVLVFHMLLQIIAGIATYYLLKRLGCRELTATLGGALFAVNGTFAWITNAAFNPVAFLPMMLLGIEILFSNYQRRKNTGWILIATSLAFSLYAGFPETAFLNGLLAAVWAGVRLFQLRKNNWQKFLLKALLGLFVGLCLAAPILLAFKDYYPYANVGSHTGGFKSYALPKTSLPALFMPYVYGPIFAYSSFDKTGNLQQFWGSVGGYTALSLFFLAFIGVFASRRNRLLAGALGLWVLIALARTYGFPGIDTVVNLIPGVSATAFFRYIPPTFELVIVVLAMLGLENLLRPHHKINRRQLYAIGSGIFLLAIVLLPIALHESRQLYLAPHHRLWLLVSVLVGVGSFLMVFVSAIALKGYSKVIIPFVVLVEALIMFMVPHLSSPRSASIDMAPVAFLKQNLDTARFYSLGPIMPNYSSYYGISSINTNNLPISKQWSGYITKSLNPNVNTIGGFTGIDKVDPNGITPLQAFTKNISSYEGVSVKYVVAFKDTIVPLTAQQSSLKHVFSDGVYEIYQLPDTKPYFQTQANSCKLAVSDKSNLTAQCEKSGMLIRRELFMPGWQVTVNDKQAALTQHGSLFQQVVIPKGQTRIHFTFLPPHMKLALVAMIAGFLIVAGALASEQYHLVKRLK